MEQAIQLLIAFLTEHNLLGRKRQLEDAKARGLIKATTGDDVTDGVSVTFLTTPRFVLVVQTPTTEGGPYVRAEGSVDIVTMTSPNTATTFPPTVEEGLIVTSRPYQYVTLTPEEVWALPGATSFIPAMESHASDKALEMGKPPVDPGPPDNPGPPDGGGPPE